jgi:hypothetical protein
LTQVEPVDLRGVSQWFASDASVATGDERLAVQLELAQRYRDAGQYALAVRYYKLVADATDRKYLREEALRLAEKYSQELAKQQGRRPR